MIVKHIDWYTVIVSIIIMLVIAIIILYTAGISLEPPKWSDIQSFLAIVIDAFAFVLGGLIAMVAINAYMNMRELDKCIEQARQKLQEASDKNLKADQAMVNSGKMYKNMKIKFLDTITLLEDNVRMAWSNSFRVNDIILINTKRMYKRLIEIMPDHEKHITDHNKAFAETLEIIQSDLECARARALLPLLKPKKHEEEIETYLQKLACHGSDKDIPLVKEIEDKAKRDDIERVVVVARRVEKELTRRAMIAEKNNLRRGNP